MLLPFCELAFTDLVSAGTKLVFHRGQLERQLGKSHVDLAYRLGLISQTKVYGKDPERNVSVSFYHKSVQELLAALHMIFGTSDAVTSFSEYCSTLEKVMETANITKFVVGLDPSLGCRICEHITNIINMDMDITKYRRTLGWTDSESTVLQLYRTQCEWYREAMHIQTVTGYPSPPPRLYIKDIYLDRDIDMDTVCLTGELMGKNLDSIVSVRLSNISLPLYRILQYLPQCLYLSVLRIYNMNNKENRDKLLGVIPHLTQIHSIRYGGALSAAVDRDVMKAVMTLTQLARIQLWRISLDDDGVVLTDMKRLQTINLRHMYMAARNWDKFLTSLLTFHQAVHVTLEWTDIDGDTVSRLKTSPRLIVTQDGGRDESSKYVRLEFATVPLHTA